MENTIFKPEEETLLVAVCGLHMRGYPLEKQMLKTPNFYAFLLPGLIAGIP